MRESKHSNDVVAILNNWHAVRISLSSQRRGDAKLWADITEWCKIHYSVALACDWISHYDDEAMTVVFLSSGPGIGFYGESVWYMSSSMREYAIYYLFKNLNDAIHFKLQWGR